MPFEPGRYQHLRGNVSWRRSSSAPEAAPADAPCGDHDQTTSSVSSSSDLWREFAHLALSAKPLQAFREPDTPPIPARSGRAQRLL